MAEQITPIQQAMLDQAARSIVATAQCTYPAEPRKAAVCALAAASLYGELAEAQIVAAKVRELVNGEPGGYVAANGVAVGRFGPHAGDSEHQAAFDYEITEGGR